MTHPIENTVRITLENLRQLADANTIIGEPVLLSDGTVILPVSRVSLGFLSGGGEYESKRPIKSCGDALEEGGARLPFAATAAAGVGLVPVSFLSVRDGRVCVLPADNGGALPRIVEMIPDALAAAESIITKLLERKKDAE